MGFTNYLCTFCYVTFFSRDSGVSRQSTFMSPRTRGGKLFFAADLAQKIKKLKFAVRARRAWSARDAHTGTFYYCTFESIAVASRSEHLTCARGTFIKG